ncbi:MAG TPA: site-specific DNA-methyltransferase, partial [Edaphobacter sp.]|uniref:site-specific DNA-methyltransferase n=1 Tax=Edaphobacter sp. TaxID=1934404 RepID=UPI002C66D11F
MAKSRNPKGKAKGQSEPRGHETRPLEVEEFSLAQQVSAAETKPVTSKSGKLGPRKSKASSEPEVLSYRHKDKRKNNPDVGLVTPDTDRVAEPKDWKYDPHIDPALQFDMKRSQVERLIDDALASKDEAIMRAALEQLKRQAEPYLNWTGKAERTSFDVDTVSLHVHERIDPATVLATVRKRMKGEKGGEKPMQEDFLKAWFEEPLPLREAIDFYKHERGWANRLIAGDSLLVMNSLLQKESMAGQVQMVYIDPPYGIKYGSNFQPFVNKREVKDRKDEDLTQEPEMIKAFRDTWELGIHSYLTYLRDRLLLTKELLSESGSVFVQISDENVHLVRNLLDEVFGTANFCSEIIFRKTTGKGSQLLDTTNDFILWYAKDVRRLKYKPTFEPRSILDEDNLRFVELTNGSRRRLTTDEIIGTSSLPSNSRVYRPNPLTNQRPRQGGDLAEFAFQGRIFTPGAGTFRSDERGLTRLAHANRLLAVGTSLTSIRYLNDFEFKPRNNIWDDTRSGGYGEEKHYVVQTGSKVIERCLLMVTDPGDLVLDPTCGSGTTAVVAEKCGRRWITCDTSRVAMTLAKQRLLTASYDYYDLKYPHEGLKAGFIYKTVPHVKLKSIANNSEIDAIYEREHPLIEAALVALNAALRTSKAPAFKVTEGNRKNTLLQFARDALQEWEVPFDYPENWPASVRAAFDTFRNAHQNMQKRMDMSIAAHAEQETLYDQPQVSKDKLRISGPFTVEAVPFPSVKALDEREQPQEADSSVARSGESGRQHSWRDELLKTGIRGKSGQAIKIAALETVPGLHYIHASGLLADNAKERVVVSFGPEYAALEQRQVEMAMREAGELFPRPKMIIFCAFTFDPEAAKDID